MFDNLRLIVEVPFLFRSKKVVFRFGFSCQYNLVISCNFRYLAITKEKVIEKQYY